MYYILNTFIDKYIFYLKYGIVSSVTICPDEYTSSLVNIYNFIKVNYFNYIIEKD